MKVFIILSVVIAATLAADESCHRDIDASCTADPSSNDIRDCNARYGDIKAVEPDIQAYINAQLATSYQYLKASTFFNSYKRDRPGFVKLFRSLSDKAFEDSIKLIKQITKRGGQIDPKFHGATSNNVQAEGQSWEGNEVTALGSALDKEKSLANLAIQIHSKASKKHYDPEISQFLEEEFLSKQSDVIRKLSGYSNDLFNMVKKNAQNLPALSIYLFDQYLQKQ